MCKLIKTALVTEFESQQALFESFAKSLVTLMHISDHN